MQRDDKVMREARATLPGLGVTSHFVLNLMVWMTALTYTKANEFLLSETRKHHHDTGMDIAQLQVHLLRDQLERHRNNRSNYDVLFQSVECVGCPFWLLGSHVKEGQEFKVNATFPQRLRVVTSSSGSCDLTYQFWDRGVYRLTIGGGGCDLEILVDPPNPFLPIAIAFVVLFVLPVLLSLIYRSRSVNHRKFDNNCALLLKN